MARDGWRVKVIEKNGRAGGRAGRLTEAGFSFDTGPSFYWMPDVFERYFKQFGRDLSDYYSLRRLDPSYRVYWHDEHTDIPADLSSLKDLFENYERGAGKKLEKYLEEASYKYRVGINHLVYKPGLSFTEFMEWPVIRGAFRLDIARSIKKHIGKFFSHPKLRQLMEFPVLFLGALPENTPALYSLMNYADMVGGTWYPGGGMYSVVEGMRSLAAELGVHFHFDETVTGIEVASGRAKQVITNKDRYLADVVISGADYHFTEKELLPPQYRSYSDSFWTSRKMAPSCLLYYVGLDKKLKNIRHHTLFFDVPFEPHAREIYSDPAWPKEPLFYVSAPSVTDDTVAPPGCENLVILVPVAAGLEGDTEELRKRFFDQVVRRMELRLGEPLLDSVVYYRSYSVSDFAEEYNSYRGNAYGLANTLGQTAIFRPSCKSKKVKNLFYAGQLTVPGPGVPPSLISGEVSAKQALKIAG